MARSSSSTRTGSVGGKPRRRRIRARRASSDARSCGRSGRASPTSSAKSVAHLALRLFERAAVVDHVVGERRFSSSGICARMRLAPRRARGRRAHRSLDLDGARHLHHDHRFVGRAAAPARRLRAPRAAAECRARPAGRRRCGGLEPDAPSRRRRADGRCSESWALVGVAEDDPRAPRGRARRARRGCRARRPRRSRRAPASPAPAARARSRPRRSRRRRGARSMSGHRALAGADSSGEPDHAGHPRAAGRKRGSRATPHRLTRLQRAASARDPLRVRCVRRGASVVLSVATPSRSSSRSRFAR